MTDDRAIPGEADPDLAAAELALGLLEGDELAVALRRLLAEPGFARQVDVWRAHFAQLFVDWPEVTPPQTALGRIERAIDTPEAPRRAAGGWPALAIVSMLAAACLLLVVLLRPAAQMTSPLPPPPAPPSAPSTMLVAQLVPSKDANAGTEPVAAIYDPVAGGVRVAHAAYAEADRSAELWVIPSDGVPRPLGLLRDDDRSTLPVAPEHRPQLAPGATLAVSIEPAGGSPTGQPTGPVVATGTLSQV